MNDEIVVRRATKADRSSVLVFHLGLYVEHRGRVTPAELEPFFAHRSFGTVLRDDVDAMLHDRSTIVLIAERAGVPVGYASGTISHDPRRVLAKKGTVGDWYVDEPSRGTGAGKALLAELERIFVEAGCEVMESATWSFNHPARAAHEALGFREVQVVYRKRI
jgi:L-amino acid N-acyltransferase YncA